MSKMQILELLFQTLEPLDLLNLAAAARAKAPEGSEGEQSPLRRRSITPTAPSKAPRAMPGQTRLALPTPAGNQIEKPTGSAVGHGTQGGSQTCSARRR